VAAAEDMALAASAEQQRLEEIVQQCRIASDQMAQFALGACATVSESLEASQTAQTTTELQTPTATATTEMNDLFEALVDVVEDLSQPGSTTTTITATRFNWQRWVGFCSMVMLLVALGLEMKHDLLI